MRGQNGDDSPRGKNKDYFSVVLEGEWMNSRETSLALRGGLPPRKEY